VEASPRASHRHVTKPVSRVLYRALHGSAAMTIHLVRLSPGASCDQPGRLVWKRDWRICTRRAAPIRSCSRWGLPCRSCCQDRGALLPHPFTLTSEPEAVCFLWHCPWGRPRRRLSGTVLPRSPDFPPCLPIRWQLAERPSGLLTELIRGFGRLASSWLSDQEGQALNAISAMARSSLRLAPPAACTDMP
jgi:hypothetical protein